jgi:uncharacterized protein (TIGR02145 family)
LSKLFYSPYSKDVQMKRFTLLFAALVGASCAVAQSDTALVPFVVNVNATVKAVQGSGGANARTVSMQVTADEEKILRMPLSATTGVAFSGAQRRTDAPAVIKNRTGKITVNLPEESYRNAEIALYSVNGKVVLRQKAFAVAGANSISRRNLAQGAYLLSVGGRDGNKFASRLTHRGGSLDLNVAFGNESENRYAPATQLGKAAEAVSWTITVSAIGYDSANYAFVPVAGENPPHNINLSAGYGPPAYVNATSLSTDRITLNWAKVNGATAYRIYRSENSDGTYSLVGSEANISYTNSGLSSNTTYYYQVSAFSGSGESARSSPVFARTAIFNPPPIDAGGKRVRTKAVAGGITVSWYAVTGAEGYNIYVSSSETGVYSLLETTTAASSYDQSYTHEGLELNATYYYKVAAYSSNGEGLLSSAVAGKVVYSALTDTRDNRKYKIVNIGSQTWMAENLRYNGRSVYNWATAMGEDAFFNENLWGGSDVRHQGVCPAGWHLPSRAEWGTLAKYAGGTGDYGAGGTAGTKLKAKSDWDISGSGDGKGNGTDDFYFSALPTDGTAQTGPYHTTWWTATEYDGDHAYYRSMDYRHEELIENCCNQYKNSQSSVRCVKDD